MGLSQDEIEFNAMLAASGGIASYHDDTHVAEEESKTALLFSASDCNLLAEND